MIGRGDIDRDLAAALIDGVFDRFIDFSDYDPVEAAFGST